MKKLLAAIAISTITFSVQANEDVTFCSSVSELGKVIMDLRQKNVPMVTLMEYMTTQPELYELGSAMIVEAYNQPRYSTPSNQQNAVTDFANDMFKVCLETRR